METRTYAINGNRWTAKRITPDKVTITSPSGIDFDGVTFDQVKRTAERVERVRND